MFLSLPMTFYAHSRPDPDRRRWQELRKHLDEVATLAEQFAPGKWKAHARVAGLWHDAGKYQLDFQRYIERDVEASNEGAKGRRIQHAIVGAAHALRTGMDLLPIALAVQAHHGRLKNPGLLEDAITNTGATLLRDAERDGLPQDLMEVAVPRLPPEAQDRGFVDRRGFADTVSWTDGTDTLGKMEERWGSNKRPPCPRYGTIKVPYPSVHETSVHETSTKLRPRNFLDFTAFARPSGDWEHSERHCGRG